VGCSRLKVRIEKPDRVLNEKGEHVGTIVKKSFMKMEIYCFLCGKTVSSLKHFEEEH
jgi:hypothetical protein